MFQLFTGIVIQRVKFFLRHLVPEESFIHLINIADQRPRTVNRAEIILTVKINACPASVIEWLKKFYPLDVTAAESAAVALEHFHSPFHQMHLLFVCAMLKFRHPKIIY